MRDEKLIKEAKDRGYKMGILVNCLMDNKPILTEGRLIVDAYGRLMFFKNEHEVCFIYIEGKWADIVYEKFRKKMNNEREKLYLSKEVIKDLFSKQILTRSYEEQGAYLLDSDKLIVHLKEEEEFKVVINPAKAIKPEGVSKWIEEWRDLFPKGKNPNTDILFKGDKLMCLKNMTKFIKDYDFTKEEIFEVTQKAIDKARDENWLYFPAAHYFIHKQDRGSKLAELLEFKKEGGENERKRYTGI